MSEPMLVCHGGAGHTAKDQPGVDKAADAGWHILSAGGSAVEAVVAAVQIMEDDPQLNAGTGGRKRADGSVQLDAAIATSDGRLGAIMAIEDTPNPIQVAAGLLNESIHILVGEGARQWADQQGFPKAKVRGSDSPSGNDTVGVSPSISRGSWPLHHRLEVVRVVREDESGHTTLGAWSLGRSKRGDCSHWNRGGNHTQDALPSCCDSSGTIA